jgi:acetyl-CoA C-acetyltransferase
VKPIDLIATVFDAIRQRNDLDTSQVDDLILGCVTPVGEQGGNIAKAAALYAGWHQSVAGVQLNRQCGSALEAINIAAMKIRSGWEDLVVAGGVESMSRVPMGSDGGPLLFDPAVNATINYIPQGVSADLLATLEGYSRAQLDEYALQSQQRALKAQTAGYFAPSLVPIHDMNGLVVLDHDEYLRPNTNLDALAKLQPSFAKQGALGFDTMAIMRYPFLDKITHHHTAGNSSGIVDGAAAVLLGSLEKANELGITPKAKILSVAVTSAEPTLMLDGNIPAAEKALRKANLTIQDIDLWEVNEAFAGPLLKFKTHFGIDNDTINVNGGVIALGHPLGATGAILLANLVNELERRSLSKGVVAMCIAGGMGVATIVELV